MSILNVENLNFCFGDKILLNNVSFRLLQDDHAGLVGANGAGKTTFFNILTGKLMPDSGSVSKSSGIKIGYLDQHTNLQDGYSIDAILRSAFDHLYALENEMIRIGDELSHTKNDTFDKLLLKFGRLQDTLQAQNFYGIEKRIGDVAGGLGLQALDMTTPVEQLSGGQRTKVKLGKLLLEHPDLLLLDEPTNYLDEDHVDWLANFLNTYPKSFMVISHDTGFLNRITNVIYHIEFGFLNRYPGDYDTFLELKEAKRKSYIDQYNRQQKEIIQLESFINKNIVRASSSKQAKSRRKKLAKIKRLERPKTQAEPSFTFLTSRPSDQLVFKSSHLHIGYTDPIIKDLNLKLVRGEKVAITGCNGIGKSTLLKTIMERTPSLAGSLHLGNYLYPSYFEQLTKVTDHTPLEEIRYAFPKKSEKEIRSALARCGLRQEHVLRKMSNLSGGEQSKVKLCKLMLSPSNWLLLDEPTNHLDGFAKRALKEALIEYDGTILLVCHERGFYKDWVTDVWDMESYVYEKRQRKLTSFRT